MQKRYHFLRVSTFVQATEDRSKVMEAVKNLLGGEIPNEPTITAAEGVFHNPIEYLVFELTRSRDIRRVLSEWEKMDFWSNGLSRIEDRLDEDLIYHVRLDKQKVLGGNISLWKGGEAIEVQLKPATFPSSRERAKAIILEGSLT